MKQKTKYLGEEEKKLVEEIENGKDYVEIVGLLPKTCGNSVFFSAD